MRIRLTLSLDVERRTPEPPSAMPPGALNDNDQTLVEHAGAQRMGFTIPHAAPPYAPDDDESKR